MKSTRGLAPEGSVRTDSTETKSFGRAGLIGLIAAAMALPWGAPAADLAVRSRVRIYDESADGSKQINDAVFLAKSAGKHVLLQFGGNWCVWCIKLHGLFETNTAIRDTLKSNYVVALIDYNDRNKHLASKYSAQDLGLPSIVILDAQGERLITKNTEQLEEGDHHSPEKVLTFLNEWTPAA